MPNTTVLIMVDGLDPEYLEQCPASNLRQMGNSGFMTVGRAMMPTVTNVNNVSLVTASYPEKHGITSNYWLDRETGTERYMESGEYIQQETIFQRATSAGARSLLITSNSDRPSVGRLWSYSAVRASSTTRCACCAVEVQILRPLIT